MSKAIPHPKHFDLRPGIINPKSWNPERPPKAEWNRIRKAVLKRDDYTCSACGHQAMKYMNIDHIENSHDNNPANLRTLCVACHAVVHIGRNLNLKILEIWESDLSQVEIVQHTREGFRDGKSLAQINSSFNLKPGPHPPDSILYANELVRDIGDNPRAYLMEPLSAVYVNLKHWQLE